MIERTRNVLLTTGLVAALLGGPPTALIVMILFALWGAVTLITNIAEQLMEGP